MDNPFTMETFDVSSLKSTAKMESKKPPTDDVEATASKDGLDAPTETVEKQRCWNPFHDIRTFIANTMVINICSIGLLAANVGSLR